MNTPVEEICIHVRSMIHIHLHRYRSHRSYTPCDLLRQTSVKKSDLDSRRMQCIRNPGSALGEVSFNGSNLDVCFEIHRLRLRLTRGIEEPGCGPFRREDGRLNSLLGQTGHEHLEVLARRV